MLQTLTLAFTVTLGSPVGLPNDDVVVPMSTQYTCYRYVSGKPTGTWIHVSASSKDEAEQIAYRRFKELGGRVDYAKCRV